MANDLDASDSADGSIPEWAPPPWMALADRAATMRGKFLNAAILVESYLDDLLSDIFSGDLTQKLALQGFIFATAGITLHSKAEVLRRVLREWYPGLYRRALFTDLDKVRQFRNDLAHTAADTIALTHPVPVDGIYLMKTKGHRQEFQLVTQADLLAHLDRAILCVQALGDLHQALWDRRENPTTADVWIPKQRPPKLIPLASPDSADLPQRKEIESMSPPDG